MMREKYQSVLTAMLLTLVTAVTPVEVGLSIYPIPPVIPPIQFPAPRQFIIYASNNEIHFVEPNSGMDFYIDLGMPVSTPVGANNTIVFASPEYPSSSAGSDLAADSDLYLIRWDPDRDYSYTYDRQPKLFTAEGLEYTPCISKDEGKIAYSKLESAGTTAIFLVDVNDALHYGNAAEQRRIELGPTIEEFPSFPDFSPDGGNIVFSSEGRIEAVNLDTEEVERLVSGSYMEFPCMAPSWSPAGSPFLVYSRRDDNLLLKQYDLYRVSPGKIIAIGAKMTDTPNYSELRSKFSPDGKHIVYERFEATPDYPVRSAEIRLAEIDTSTANILSDRKIIDVASESFFLRADREDFPDTPAPAWFACDQLVIFDSIVKGKVGEDLTYKIPVFGGTYPYTCTLVPPLLSSLPPGLTFEGGVLSGIPTTPGSYKVTVKVKDALGSEVTADYNIIIENARLKTIVKDKVADSINLNLNTIVYGGKPPYSFRFDGANPFGLEISSGMLTGTPRIEITPVKLVVEDRSAQSVRPSFYIYSPSRFDMLTNSIDGNRSYNEEESELFVADDFPGYPWLISDVVLNVTETPDGRSYRIPIEMGNIWYGSIHNLNKEDLFRDVTTPYETVKAKLELEFTATLEEREFSSDYPEYGELRRSWEETFYADTSDLLIARDEAQWYSFRFDNPKTPELYWDTYQELFGCGDLYHCACWDGCPCCDATRLCCSREDIPEYIFDNYYRYLAAPGNCFGMCTAAWKIRQADTYVGNWFGDDWWISTPIYEATLDTNRVYPVRDDPKIFGTLRHYINAMHGWQLDWDVMKHVVEEIDPDHKDLAVWTQQVINELTNNDPDEFILGITEVSELGSRGHALAPYEVVRIGDDYYILCYDPNRPLSDSVAANHQSYVKVRPGYGWEYIFDDGTVWRDGYIETVPKSLLKGNARFPGPFDLVAEFFVIVTGAEISQITDELGTHLFDANGTLTTNRSTMDVVFYPVFGGNGNATMLIMGNGTYTFNLNANQGYKYALLTPNRILGLESSSGGSDVLTINRNGNTIEFYSPEAKYINFTMIRELPIQNENMQPATTKTIAIRNFDLKGRVRFSVGDENIEVLSNQKTVYEIHLKLATPDFTGNALKVTEFSHIGVEIPTNQSQKLIPSSDFSYTTLLKDADSDGVFESEQAIGKPTAPLIPTELSGIVNLYTVIAAVSIIALITLVAAIIRRSRKRTQHG